ncbi:hypothetical protein ACOKWO_003377 [Vibrio parahaemolyticus]|nr:hypothetical protein [Vibrio parahaemolyticus]
MVKFYLDTKLAIIIKLFFFSIASYFCYSIFEVYEQGYVVGPHTSYSGEPLFNARVFKYGVIAACATWFAIGGVRAKSK